MIAAEITAVTEGGKHAIEHEEQISVKRIKVDDTIEAKAISSGVTQPTTKSKPDPTLYGLTEFINTSFNPN